MRSVGVDELDQIFTVLLKTSMAVGGIIACFLDNIVPGTATERGIRKWKNIATGTDAKNVASTHVYDLPFGVMKKLKISKYLPFLPYNNEQLEQVETEGNGAVNMEGDTEAKLETPEKITTVF